MSESHSISCWIDSLRDADSQAAEQIWNRFHKRLTGFAARHLRSGQGRMADGEDVVVEAFASFFRRAEAGQFPDLRDRQGLWRLLLTITERKARNQNRHDRSQKRGRGEVRGDSVFYSQGDGQPAGGFDQFATADPAPDDVLILKETFAGLLAALNADQVRVATLKMQGYSNREISDLAECSVATVERRLSQIRTLWTRILDAAE